MELDICFPGFCSLGQKSGFPGSSAGREYTCNARDPALILGSGRSPGGGIGYPLQYSWWFSRQRIFLQFGTPGFSPWVGKISMEKEMATHSSIVAWRIPWTEEPGGLQSMGSQLLLAPSTPRGAGGGGGGRGGGGGGGRKGRTRLSN